MSGQLAVTAFVQVSGPLFDGRAEQAVQEMTRATTRAIADEGADMLRKVPMDKSGRSTGAFRAHLQVLQRGSDGTAYEIPAPAIKGVTWGPWLEGATRRNSSTKFRGYGLFRKTAAALDLAATGIAERELEQYLPKMGGE